MENKIIEIAENLINVRRLKEELNDESYWIDKAAKETDFVPAAGCHPGGGLLLRAPVPMG